MRDDTSGRNESRKLANRSHVRLSTLYNFNKFDLDYKLMQNCVMQRNSFLNKRLVAFYLSVDLLEPVRELYIKATMICTVKMQEMRVSSGAEQV